MIVQGGGTVGPTICKKDHYLELANIVPLIYEETYVDDMTMLRKSSEPFDALFVKDEKRNLQLIHSMIPQTMKKQLIQQLMHH